MEGLRFLRTFAACAIGCVLLVLPTAASPAGPGYRGNGFFRPAPYDRLGFQARAEAVAGSDGSNKAIELSAAWQYR